MKLLFIFTINIYQKIISPMLHQLFGVNSACRFSQTCSEYAKHSVLKYGLFKGSYLSFVRLAKCQPFYSAS